MIDNPPIPDHIRDTYGAQKRWVGWRYAQPGNRKVPVGSDGWASTVDPHTWLTLSDAERLPAIEGVGIVLTGDGLGGVDLDDCVDPETGQLDEWAAEIVREFRSYTEVSPSGTGVKILAEGAPGKLPGTKWRPQGADGHADIFVSRRYFTVTGRPLPDSPDEITDAGDPGGPWDRLVMRIGEQSRSERPEVTVPISGDRPEREAVVRRIAQHPRSRHRWEVGADNPDDRSACDAALAVAMASDDFSPEEIAAALESYPLGQVASGDLPAGQIARQVQRLVDYAEPHRPKAQEQHPTEREYVREVAGEWFDRHLQSEQEREAREQAALDEPLGTPEELSVGRLLELVPEPQEWLLDDVLPLGVCGMLGAAGGAGKSTAVLQLAICVAMDVPWWGLPISRPGSVLIISAEDDTDVIHRRLHRIMEHSQMSDPGHSCDFSPLRDKLYLVDRVGDTNLLTMVRDRELVRTGFERRIVATANQLPDLRLVVVDPLSRFRGGGANDEESGTRLVEAMEYIRRETGATVLAPAHTRKRGGKPGEDDRLSQDDIRGSSALVDGMRWVAVMQGMSQAMAKKRGMPESEADHWVQFGVVKNNYAPPFPGLWLRRMTGGVLEPRELPDEAHETPGGGRIEQTYRHVLGLVVEKLQQDGPVYTARDFRDMAGQYSEFGVGKRAMYDILKRGVSEGPLYTRTDPSDARRELLHVR